MTNFGAIKQHIHLPTTVFHSPQFSSKSNLINSVFQRCSREFCALQKKKISGTGLHPPTCAFEKPLQNSHVGKSRTCKYPGCTRDFSRHCWCLLFWLFRISEAKVGVFLACSPFVAFLSFLHQQHHLLPLHLNRPQIF